MDATASEGRHVTGDTTRIIVSHVRAKGGDAAVSRMLNAAAERRSASDLEQDTCWSSYQQARALLESAVEALGDPHTFRDLSALHEANRRRVDRVGGETTAVFQTLGSPGEIFRHIELAAARYFTVATMEAAEVAEDFAVVTATGTDEFPRFRALCDLTAGLLASAPILFGFEPATVVEEACQTRGDDRCVYRISWRPIEGGLADPELRNRHLHLQVSLLTARLNNLRAAAGDLVSGEDVGTVLARVTARAGIAVRAPRFFLAVIPEAGQPPQVHHDGFADPREARDLAARVLAGEADDDPSFLVVEVRSGRRAYGWLAACHTRGASFFPEERVLLQAYAGLAAAALDAATALDEARHQAETARVLLTLAEALAQVGPRAEVAQRLAEAVPSVIDAERSVVMLWDKADEVLRTAGVHGLHPDAEAFMRQLTISHADASWIAELMANAAPRFIDDVTEDPFLHDVLRATGATSVVAVPIVAGGEFLGLVAASTSRSSGALRRDDHGVARVRGIASQAAVALQNAALLEQVRHQATHDPHTGLPNRTLLVQLTEQALRHAARDGHHVGLLFADLDRLKDVNDTMGHNAGDELIRAVAQRFRRSLRDSDVLARLGGDEFVVLLLRATPASAAEVARKLASALTEPFAIAGHEVRISASIGVAVSPGDGETYEALLAHADTAMYEVKSRCGVTRPGPASSAVAQGGPPGATASGRRS